MIRPSSPLRVVRLVEPHLALALGTGKRIGLIDFSDEVRPALF